MVGRRPSKGTSVFGKRLALLRKDRGLSQSELAVKLGISQTMVAYYENHSPSPAVDVAKRCADVLGVSLAALVDENKEPRRVKPGPKSQLDERVEKVKGLPRRQQELVIALLDAFLEQNGRGT